MPVCIDGNRPQNYNGTVWIPMNKPGQKPDNSQRKNFSGVIFAESLSLVWSLLNEDRTLIRNMVMKYRFTTLIFFLGMLLSFNLHAQDEKKANVNTNEKIGEALTDFSFEIPTGKRLTKENLPADQPVIFFYFDPDCDHCNKQAAMLKEKPHLFEGVTLVWVSWAETHQLNIDFAKKYFMNMGTEVYVVKDVDYAIDTYFGYSEVPSIYVYNREWKRTASFKAETFPEILVKFAHSMQ